MQPQQIISPNYPPPTPAVPPGNDQYDFIVNYGNRQPGGFFGTGTSMKTRIIVVATGGLLLILIAWIFFALLTNTGSVNSGQLITLVQQQAELARISKQPATQATGQTAQNLAATTELSLISQETSLLQFLQAHGTNPSAEVIAAKRSSSTDSTLLSAQTSGTYDQTYTSLATSQLQTYAQTLKQAYAGAQSQTERTLLNNAYDDAQLLLKLAGGSS